MPRSTIEALRAAVLAPGSPDASHGSGNGAPSVCSTSYLGIPQTGWRIGVIQVNLSGQHFVEDSRAPVGGWPFQKSCQTLCCATLQPPFNDRMPS
jgi:hypothetical protein